LARIYIDSRSQEFLLNSTIQCHISSGRHGEQSYPELTKPLREMTKKNSKFVWGTEQKLVFKTLKERLCSTNVLVPYDTKLPTHIYVDSSAIGTQAQNPAQNHSMEAAYGQLERIREKVMAY